MAHRISDVLFHGLGRLLARHGKPTIGFGLATPNSDILASLRRAKHYAQIILVGPRRINRVKGFKRIVDVNPEKRLASMLAHDQVEGIVRGTIDDFKTFEAYQRLTGEQYTIEPALMEDPRGHQFLISPISNPEGWTKEQRLHQALELSKLLKDLGITSKIAVFTGERHETYPRKKRIRTGVVGLLNRTYKDAEWIIHQLRKKGLTAKNWAIDLNLAVEAGWNVIIPVNGMVGNQIFRAVLFSGGKILAAPRMGLSRFYEENSRTEKDFFYHVLFLTIRILQSKKRS